MATVTGRIDARPDQVWDVLADGWPYSNWVVGSSHMRAVEAAWPAAGSRLFHASGVWPATLRDETPVSGPARLVPSPLTEALLLRRNRESVARRRALAERRTRAGG